MERELKIGELAARTGLTVRTIRYYEEIGLLKAVSRSPSGYRKYGISELEQIQKVQSLKHLGLQLDEIGDYLDGRENNLENIIYRQMKQVRTEIELGRELYGRLQKLANYLKSSKPLSADDLIETLNTMTMYEKYYSSEQMEYLEQRRKEVGEERIQEAQEEWATLIKQARDHLNKGTDPGSEVMQQLAEKWNGLIQEFTGGDPGIRESLANMYKNEGPENASRGMADNEVMEYMGKAIDIYGSGK